MIFYEKRHRMPFNLYVIHFPTLVTYKFFQYFLARVWVKYDPTKFSINFCFKLGRLTLIVFSFCKHTLLCTIWFLNMNMIENIREFRAWINIFWRITQNIYNQIKFDFNWIHFSCSYTIQLHQSAFLFAVCL